MLSSFRRLQKSKLGTIIIAGFFILVLIGFASTGVSNFGSGNIGFGGMGSSTLASVGDQEVSERDLSSAMQRRLQQIRQQKPEADYAAIAGDFPTLLGELIDQRTLLAFADKFNFPLSKRLIDAEIAQIPQTRGLNGKFSQQAYQQFLAQERLSDTEVRQILAGGLLQKLLLTPIATNARVSIGMATPYASMLLEEREGEAAVVPTEPFKAGFKPTDAQLQAFYATWRTRYMIPEQRVLRIAQIGPDQVANVAASDQEIAAYYNANKAAYAAKETRNITQVVAQDQATANAIAARAKGGATLAVAPAAAGAAAAVSTQNDQSRDAYAGVAGARAAAAVFAAKAGTIVGPVQSDFGWVVAKVDSVKTTGGKSLDQARAEIAAKLNADKRKEALEDLVDKVQNALDNGSNFAEAVAAAKLPVTTTALITANGTSRTDPSYKFPAELAPALKTGFEIAPNDPPEVLSLPGDAGSAVVSPAQVVASAPAPLASIRDQVANDWITQQAMTKARQVADQLAAKASGAVSLADAVKAAGVAIPPVHPLSARRIQVATAQNGVPPAMRLLFTLGQGKSQAAPDPQGRGFYVVKVSKITPGNAIVQPQLIGRMQGELGDALTQDYADEFVAALRRELKVKRNDSAIQAFRTRLVEHGG